MKILLLVSFTWLNFIEHHFFGKIAILTKLSAKISLKRLQSTYNNILSWLTKFPQNRRNRNRETVSTSRQQRQMEFELLTAARLSTFDLKALNSR